MAGCASIRQTDTRTDKEQTCRQEDAATVDFGLCFLPIQSYKENDIIPVLIGQQEVHTTSEKSTSLHSIHPIELPALVINSEPCAVTAGLWTQQLAAGRQALFHRICPPISCTQLSSSSPVALLLPLVREASYTAVTIAAD
ncbi:hypothetical protein PAMA_019109 [Pampus argenteus]